MKSSIQGDGGLSDVQRELDDAICELGRCAERAMADGDPAGARIYSDRMMAAIKNRTPEHVARLEREAYDRVTEQCAYFTSDAALALAQGRAA